MIVGVSYVAVNIWSLLNTVILAYVTPQQYSSLFFDYVICESTGIEEGKTCEQFIDTSKILPIYILTIITVIIQTTVPIILLFINIEQTIFTKIKAKCFVC